MRMPHNNSLVSPVQTATNKWYHRHYGNFLDNLYIGIRKISAWLSSVWVARLRMWRWHKDTHSRFSKVVCLYCTCNNHPTVSVTIKVERPWHIFMTPHHLGCNRFIHYICVESVSWWSMSLHGRSHWYSATLSHSSVIHHQNKVVIRQKMSRLSTCGRRKKMK